jgi:hypothetical protein
MIRHALILLLAWACSTSLHAQDVRRCLQSDGTVVITDGVCATDAIEKARVPEPALHTPGLPKRAGIATPPACNAQIEDLQYSVRTAIDMRDINQLAKHYHWPGVSDAQAEQIMNRLERLVLKPVLDIQPLFAQARPEPDFDYVSPDEIANAQSAQAPYGLKITQYQSNANDTLQSSTFRLQRHFNCWWIRY